MNAVVTFLLLAACIVNSEQTTCGVGYECQACIDVNECETNNGGCDVHATCTNSVGSFSCACNAGFSGNGFTCTENFRNIGCFKDSADRDLDGSATLESTGMTVQMCLADCANRGLRYAGLQASAWCLCGNSYGKHGTATNCDMACVGNANDNCGGSWANSVWVSERNLPSSHHVGCFADSADRDLNSYIWYDASMSAYMCVSDCQSKGYTYAGLQASAWCLCGNSYGKHGAATNCDMACVGNSNDNCGGSWANSVWTTGN